jgi:photosystem II stability/assembly factor-like uncharacterized protein
LFVSDNDGKSWHGGPALGMSSFVSVCPANKAIVAATLNRVLVSTDDGSIWRESTLPEHLATIRSLAVAPDSSLWIASREGAFRSTDMGEHWQRVLNGLPAQDLVSIFADADGSRMIATTGSSVFYESADGGQSWRARNAGWTIRSVNLGSGRLFGATAFAGVVAQPIGENSRASLRSSDQK